MKVEQELRRFVQSVADVSPEPPLINPASATRRRVTPAVAFAGAFVGLLVIVGVGTTWMFATDSNPPAEPTTSSPRETDVALTPAEILADGVVTETEYRGAVSAVVGCLDEQGFVTTVEFDSSGVARFDSTGPGVADAFDACFAEHLGSVATVWASQNASRTGEVGEPPARPGDLVTVLGWTPSAIYTLNPAVLVSIPREQQTALSDRVVTFDEYEEGVLAVVSCLRDSGIRASTPSIDDRRLFPYYEYGYSAVDDPESEVHDACYGQYLSIVDVVWVTQNEATSGDSQMAELDRLTQCLSAAGLDLPPDTDAGTLFIQFATGEYGQDVGTCFANYKS